MMGEELDVATVGERGIHGDRAYAIVDRSNGKIASVKNPRKWSSLFDCQAAFVEASDDGDLPAVGITLPDGTLVSSDDPEAAQLLARLLGRDVALPSTAPASSVFETFWPDLDGVSPVGLYADLVRTGTIRRGDSVRLEA